MAEKCTNVAMKMYGLVFTFVQPSSKPAIPVLCPLSCWEIHIYVTFDEQAILIMGFSRVIVRLRGDVEWYVLSGT